MQTHLHTPRSLYQLVQLLDEHDGLIDTDFDAALDDLEREFAELRITFDRNC